jgi:hypothetical protein
MSKIKTTKIGKKDYVEVDERIRLFWELHPTWSITTDMIYNCEKEMITIFKATVLDESSRIIATGHAREFQADKKSMVNKTSHVENCETSAIGRALGIKGIITEYGIASANEVRGAIELGKELDELNKKPAIPLAPPVVEFTSKPEVKAVDPNVTVANAPKEMIDSILGKSPSKSINDELVALNARAMKVTTEDEGKTISDEYRGMVEKYGKENLPKSLREVVVSSLNAARDKITREKLA